MQDLADDHERVGPHYVDDSIAAESSQGISTNHDVFMTTPDIIDAGLELDQAINVVPTLGCPIHPAHDATYPEPVAGVAAGKLFENR